MSKVLRALLISAGAASVAALALQALDLDKTRSDDSFGESGFPGASPEDFSDEDVDAMMNELARQLDL